jgi:phosphinothricin acetyltransferase
LSSSSPQGQKGRPGEGWSGPGGGLTIRPATRRDAPAITAIFNYYVRMSFAAFPDREVGRPFILRLLQAKDFGGFVAETGGDVIGFGMVRPLYPFPNLMTAGEVSFFICPQFTGRGTGTRLLGILEARAREFGMTSLVARVSSRNRQSLRFHRKNGFTLCGRIRGIGRKFGKSFDLVILQKCL